MANEIVFETERLFARPWTLEDVEAAFEIYRNAEVAHFIRDAPEESLDSQSVTLERILARYAAMGEEFGFWALVEKESGSIVGSIMLKRLPGWPEVEVGWHLARSAWGKGYATEAAKRCIRHGFDTLDVKRLVAVVNPLNTRSLAVARRLGMQHKGRIHAYDLDLELFSCERESIDGPPPTIQP